MNQPIDKTELWTQEELLARKGPGQSHAAVKMTPNRPDRTDNKMQTITSSLILLTALRSETVTILLRAL